MNTIQVVAAVLRDRIGRVLTAERPAGKPLAGYWEFPGGKLERGEPESAALRRELREELGIEVHAAYRLLGFSHLYPERRVQLHVWRVTRYAGTPVAHEGQKLAWHAPHELSKVNLLPADEPIVAALTLPPLMLVTPSPGGDEAKFLQGLRRSLEAGVDWVQFRAPGLDDDVFVALARKVIVACRSYGARVSLNSSPRSARDLGADGVHLSQEALAQLDSGEGETGLLKGISCHSYEEIRHALKYRPDYLTLGPVNPTASHADRAAIGWETFSKLVDGVIPTPVYAIGGLGIEHLTEAQQRGAHGIAAIRSLWDIGQLSESS
ncbi:MAG TPA: Nudix family hydrolase [Gammaproteobacteria bacterium]|nr:Nudix family hydrolase [Gammaproteobacteria bacterium]